MIKTLQEDKMRERVLLLFTIQHCPLKDLFKFLQQERLVQIGFFLENENKIYKLVEENKRAFHACIYAKEKRKWFPYPDEQQH